MTKALTVEEATKALDDAIAKQKAAHKAAADMYGDVVAAREALDAAFAEEDLSLPQCSVAITRYGDPLAHRYNMAVVERHSDHIKCRHIGDRGGFVVFKWSAIHGAYIATRGGAFDCSRRIAAIDGDALRGPKNLDGEATQ